MSTTYEMDIIFVRQNVTVTTQPPGVPEITDNDKPLSLINDFDRKRESLYLICGAGRRCGGCKHQNGERDDETL